MNQLIRIVMNAVLNTKTRADRKLDTDATRGAHRSATRNTRSAKMGLNMLQRVLRFLK